MSQTIDFPYQGSVYLLSKALKQSGDTKQRPVVVVSINTRNQYGSTVLVVPFSSDAAHSAENPMRVYIPAGVGGLTRDSYAMGDLTTTVSKSYLATEPYGQLPAEYLQQILQAIQIAIGIF
jgi:mRNA interferase MazF